METNLGTIDIELYDDETPATVANFLIYAGSGRYTNNGFIHRHASKNSPSGVAVIQGGGYEYFVTVINDLIGHTVRHIPELPPIKNEFSPLRSNVRGKIAMAKTSNPDSATSEWFINYDDNSAALDNPNNSGGFTVFGEVVAGMDVVDAITSLTIQDSELWINPFRRNRFNELPVLESFDPLIDLNLDGKLVMVTRIPNVKSTSTGLGTLPTYAADVDMVFDSVGTMSSDDALALLASFSSPQNQSVHFNNGIHSMKMSGVMGSAPRIVALYDGATARPNRYYAYGKTLDNPFYHWYDFTFDGETGAEFKSNRIILHFVDGKRGDDDLDPNSITHTGAQAVVTAVDDGSAQGGGCSIVGIPSDVTRSGDWIVVSLFLTILAFVRRRAPRAQHQDDRSEEDTNIASP